VEDLPIIVFNGFNLEKIRYGSCYTKQAFVSSWII